MKVAVKMMDRNWFSSVGFSGAISQNARTGGGVTHSFTVATWPRPQFDSKTNVTRMRESVFAYRCTDRVGIVIEQG